MSIIQVKPNCAADLPAQPLQRPDAFDIFPAVHFIRFYSRTRNAQWCMGEYFDESGKCCALGWLGVRANVDSDTTTEADALSFIVFQQTGKTVAQINDDAHNQFTPGANPRARILGVLKAAEARGF